MCLQNLRRFLGDIDLKFYRDRYLPLKIVEMDLPKNIQALDLLYKTYWAEREFISFDTFYERYKSQYSSVLEEFRVKTQMCEICFYKGLPARIYRTWASIITQIHAGYVAQSVFGPETVEMSSDLDHRGADFRVNYHGNKLNFQVKKMSRSREIREAKGSKKKLDGQDILIEYKVPDAKIMREPRTKKGGFKKAYSDFKTQWIDTGKLEVLDNGFVIFTPVIFSEKKAELDASE